MPITRVKICGITRPEDAALAAELGSDFLGLNFFKGPRKIGFHTAVNLIRATAQGSSRWIGLMGDTDLVAKTTDDLQAMRTALDACSYIQHYGTVAQLVDAFSRLGPASPYFENAWFIYHVPARESLRLLSVVLKSLPFTPAAVLLDTASEKLGGTGQSFNWNWVAEARDDGELDGLPPLILAGGLTPNNVADAIRIAQPYAVDISSGVEVPNQPGIKDAIKMRDFIQAVKGA